MPVDLGPTDSFVTRHLGPREADLPKMLATVGVSSLDELIARTVPADIRLGRPLDLPPPLTEAELLTRARALGAMNRPCRSFLGMGYSDTITPPVILRNVLENPGYYTQYTPYQAEISQGRLEALLNFQTMVADLTALPIANASLLDEGTAAAEAMHVMADRATDDRNTLFVSAGCHPQTIAVVQTRAAALGVDVVVGDASTGSFASAFGVVLAYPDTDGAVVDLAPIVARARDAGAMVTVVADLLALTLLVPPGELGADIAVGSAQRFGVPLGYGGPHAAYFATKQEHVRKLPGRIIGVSKDATGKPALRMALQTREQHIRREKATSNICTAQALLAITASMYAVYHGPEGLRRIAARVHGLACTLADGLSRLGVRVGHGVFFDTVRADVGEAEAARVVALAAERGMNLRSLGAAVTVALDEATTAADVDAILACFGTGAPAALLLAKAATPRIGGALARTSRYLGHPVFSSYHSETEMLRYLKALEARDLSLTSAMIPLGSCTMKLNATAEMMPITWPEFGRVHPFAPRDQAAGYAQLFAELERDLAEITGFAGISLQPNAGSQGEYAGLLVIRAYHHARGDQRRDVCLIPASAHGTNPASAVMAGMKVVVVKCDDRGNVDLADLEAKAAANAPNLAALMVTYPSTYGVFEEEIRRITEIVHAHGGQVYLDGANMNAQVGLCRPGDFGADVCHLNLHKTFCIPHGGGGPGMGPIGVAAHLVEFLPSHPVVEVGGARSAGPVSAAPWGSASILLISWAYIRMMGAAGLRAATEHAILNANYVAKRLSADYPVAYVGARGMVAHECILDTRGLKATSGVEVDDLAKRLMDYGFHAPTMSFPLPGTLMVEPTESESLAELDRLCDAMIAIREEVRQIESGAMPRDDNPLKRAPHTAEVAVGAWDRPYSREQAVFPTAWTRARKFWPCVSRVDGAFGDRNLVCTCPPVDSYG